VNQERLWTQGWDNCDGHLFEGELDALRHYLSVCLTESTPEPSRAYTRHRLSPLAA
jgi:hypothetical protein